MISSYDLLEFGFSPKYDGFKLLLEVVNEKISNPKVLAASLFKKMSPDHPGTVEKNIRVCIMRSTGKYRMYSTAKAINSLVETFSQRSDVDGVPRMKFEKVSFKQFKKDVLDCGFKFSEAELLAFYEAIKLPRRATKGSAGYDFYAPFDLTFRLGESLKFPTGIKCYMDGNVLLLLAPRSSLGFKHRMVLNNTLGVIDSDFCLAKNEGHMHAKFHYCNEELEELEIKKGEAYMQGIFVPFFTTVDDNAQGIRVGGFGSTNGKKS